MKHVITLMLVLFFITNSAYADVLIITNKNVNEKSMSANDIKEIFLGKKKKWPNSTKIHLVVLDNKELNDTFLRTYVNKTVSQYNAYWKNMLFTGKGSPPRQFETTKDLIEYVANTQGAIGYIDSGSTIMNVNTISVE